MHENRINKKRYIGITHHVDNPNRRWENGKGYYKNKHFFDAIIKYGWDNFDHKIIAKGLNKKDACKLEQELIRAYNTQDKRFGYNITNGGEFFKHTDESKLLMSKNKKGKALPPFTEEHIRKIKANHRGGAEKKKVRCVETGCIFDSINDAARCMGKSKKMISNCCRKIPHYNTAGGYHWEFC